MQPVLRLYEDVLSSAENVVFQLAPRPRFIFVVHGSATIDGKPTAAGEAWQGDSAATVKPGGTASVAPSGRATICGALLLDGVANGAGRSLALMWCVRPGASMRQSSVLAHAVCVTSDTARPDRIHGGSDEYPK